MHLRSLKPHLEISEALLLTLESHPDVLCLTETWPTESDTSESWLISGYNQLYARSRSTHGSGIMIQTRGTCCLLKQVQMPFEEGILAEKSKYNNNQN